MANPQDSTFPSGRTNPSFMGTIARTDTTAKVLFTLPAGCIPVALNYTSPAVSNAGTTATISVGKQGGTGVEFLTTVDVKGATGSGFQNPVGPAASLGGAALAAATVVTGVYAETGGASSSGGPWVIVVDVIDV